MAITGRTSNECFDQFVQHARGLVSKMLPSRIPLLCPKPPKAAHARALQKRVLRFENASTGHTVPLETRAHGTVYLYMAQELITEPHAEANHVLRTKKYWYKLYGLAPTRTDDADAIIRWEYASADPVHNTPPRHHVQFGKMVTPVPLGTSTFDLTHLHMPTGWVTVEEICRFLVSYFGIEPLCGADWPHVLAEGEEHFYGKATDRGGRGHNRG